MPNRLLTDAEHRDHTRKLLQLAAPLIPTEAPNLKGPNMRTPKEILQSNLTPNEEYAEQLREKFETLQDGIVGEAVFDRLYSRDGLWKYFDQNTNARWQGFQLAHVPQ